MMHEGNGWNIPWTCLPAALLGCILVARGHRVCFHAILCDCPEMESESFFVQLPDIIPENSPLHLRTGQQIFLKNMYVYSCQSHSASKDHLFRHRSLFLSIT